MDTMLFTADSIWTMIHGIVLGGGALLGISAALFSLVTVGVADCADPSARKQARYLGWLTILVAIALWATVIVGTYVNFPPYRATPPEGITDLSQFPRTLIMSNPATAWLHQFGMEIKEHVPWIAAMLATGVAFVAVRHGQQLARDASIRRLTTTLLAICLILVSFVSLLGVFINKVAPLD